MDGWTSPAELLQPLPRRVRMHGSIKLLITLMSVSLLGISIFLLWKPYQDARKIALLQNVGVSVEAEVTSFHSGMIGTGPQQTYSIDYQFVANGSEPSTMYQNTGLINLDNYKAMQIGQKVPVIYNPTDPKQSELNFDDQLHKRDPYDFLRLLAGIMLPCFGLSYLLITATFLGMYYRDKRLLMWGKTAEATILNEQDVRTGGLMSTIAYYQFTDDQGKIVKGSCGGLPSKGYLKYKRHRKPIDDILVKKTVVYNSSKSSRNKLYPWSIAVVCLPEVQNKYFKI